MRGFYLPDWSSTGEWITYRDKNVWWLISPDGKTVKSLGKIETPDLAFSKNGKLLYGIETGEAEGNIQRATLFSLDPVTLKRKVIRELGKDLAPQSPNSPSTAFGSPLAIINGEKAAPKITHRHTKCDSISIFPSGITANPASASGFLLTNLLIENASD